MKSIIILCLATCFSFTIHAQTNIELKDVSKHVGDSVKVEGKIFGVKTFGDKAAPVLLNLGADYPAQLLTVAVFDSYKTDTILMPAEGNKGDIAIVTGKIELYKGRPQIIVRVTSQLQLVTATPLAPVKSN